MLNATTINTADKRQPTSPLPPVLAEGLFYPTSHGDVHIRTLDGLNFDHQAVGDHVLFQSLDGEVVIQTRQEIWADNPQVSVNRAGAMRVMSDKIVWHALPEPALYVNDKLTALPTSLMILPGGGSLELTKDGRRQTLMVRWPDDRPVARMVMFTNGTMDVEVRKDTVAGRKYEGLIGNADNDRANDLQIRGGAYLDLPIDSNKVAQVGESWLVTEADTIPPDTGWRHDHAAFEYTGERQCG